MASMVAVVGERGYVETRVSDVLARAGVSRRTFYTYFINREDCFFAAYDAVVADLASMLHGGAEDAAADGISARLQRVLDHFARWPAHARMLLIEVLATGVRGAERQEQTIAALADRLAACPDWRSVRCDSLNRHEQAQAALGAMLRMVQLRLVGDSGAGMLSLAPALTVLATRMTID